MLDGLLSTTEGTLDGLLSKPSTTLCGDSWSSRAKESCGVFSCRSCTCAGGKKLYRELSIEEGLDVRTLSPQDLTAHLRTLLQTARVKYAHTPHPAWPWS